MQGTKVKFTVIPDNPSACYALSLLQDTDEADWEMARDILRWNGQTYEFYKEMNSVANYADVFCYTGERTIRITRLAKDTPHRLLVLQMNPDTQEIIGSPHSVRIRTRNLPMQDISFSFETQGDVLRIIPSDLQAPYFWEYEIENERFYDRYFGSFFSFFYEIIDLYASYGFMEKMTVCGVSEWNFVTEDPSVKPGERYTLAISGVRDGEINSKVTYIDFIYQKGDIQLLPHEEEE